MASKRQRVGEEGDEYCAVVDDQEEAKATNELKLIADGGEFGDIVVVGTDELIHDLFAYEIECILQKHIISSVPVHRQQMSQITRAIGAAAQTSSGSTSEPLTQLSSKFTVSLYGYLTRKPHTHKAATSASLSFPAFNLSEEMGQKQLPTADPISEPKKRRRMLESKPISASKFTWPYFDFLVYLMTDILVSSKEEVGASDSFRISPVDLNSFFDEDGKIYGYNELKITIWVSSISFHAFADITFQSTSDRIFADTLVDNKDDFLQTFSTERHFVRSIISDGEILQHKASNGHAVDYNNRLGTATSDLEKNPRLQSWVIYWGTRELIVFDLDNISE
ncbi:unnamed protein product [Dovyalis caffra]|uniref:histone acetyltransferase n=1 Tax=Dovyalis caffra TaxID=77055 RepID=A0AAV1S0J5_9ROSI|nr:unnamed protein product [Dovyalis caffra]